ncbi:MAG TPA: VanZ family protein [Gemmatimonadales bacterium]|nr:VanZ family protein [Gemmatimonadales bacterium]
MFLVVALLLIGSATLWPMPGALPFHPWALCFACGDHGTSDLLLNIVLFMPLGAALARRGSSRARSAVVAALLSSAIELSQMYIPGRDSSFSDIVANTTGAVVGAVVFQRAHGWLFPAPAVASRLSRAASAGMALMCLGTGLLLTPALPPGQYYGLWTPRFRSLAWYNGRVLAAAVAGTPIPPGPIPATVRDLLQSGGGFDLRLRAVAGPWPPGLAPLLTLFDDRRREVLLLAADRGEWVLRVRTRAAAWRFDRPDLRVAAPQPGSSGDTVLLHVAATNGHYAINDIERGFTAGQGWALLQYPEHLPLQEGVNAVWIAALLVPAGFWWRTRADGVIVALGGGERIAPRARPDDPSAHPAAAVGGGGTRSGNGPAVTPSPGASRRSVLGGGGLLPSARWIAGAAGIAP